jgi:predicted HicB family RNase H-like nuclease
MSNAERGSGARRPRGRTRPSEPTSSAERYTYRVLWSDEDQEFVGLCAEFSSLSWLDQSQSAALTGIVRVVRQVIDDMRKSGEDVPLPLGLRVFTGQFRVRIPPHLHRRLALEAAESRVSLNRLVSSKLI